MRGIKFRNILLSLYTLLIVCMGMATVIEKVSGKASAHESVYGSWWFIAMWAILAVTALAFLIRKKVHKRLAVMMLHVSFVVMLIGALVTHLTSESGTLHLRVGTPADTFVNESSLIRQLPFAMKLVNFDVVPYPGTDAVMDYRSIINVSHDDEEEQISVSMNNIGKVDGYRFYQSAYDSDGMGTQLLVAHDPYGIAITYTGYIMLLVSLLLTLCSKHTRIRELYRIATRTMVVALLLGIGSTSARAAEITPVSKEIAHDFGKVVVLYNGRLCPINTAANEFVTKLCGKASWNGYSADEIFMGWMIYYTEWEQQKIIRVKSAEVQRMLGIEDGWASVRDFYASDNSYKLAGKMGDDGITESTRKAIRETDEKIQVITMFYNSEMLHMFPLRIDGNMDWHVPGSTQLPLGTPYAEFQFINHAMDNLTQCVLGNDVEGARMMIAKIKLYQREKAGDVLPSNTKVNIEVIYNTLQSARWPVFVCLALSIVFCQLLLSSKRTSHRRSPFSLLPSPFSFLPSHFSKKVSPFGGDLEEAFLLLQTIYLTTLLALRWYVSGHVPMGNGYETMLFMAWVTLIITLITMRKMPVLKAFGPLVASFCMLVAMLAVGSPQITRLMPVLQSPLLAIHVAVIMMSYALIAIVTLIAVQSLVLARRGDTDELTRMTALSQLLLYPAVALLTIGMFVGAVWANVSWGTYWSWDPKETWALITMMIYALPLHRSLLSVSPTRYHLYILLSFLSVLMTYFGVNYFLTGMHSYA